MLLTLTQKPTLTLPELDEIRKELDKLDKEEQKEAIKKSLHEKNHDLKTENRKLFGFCLQINKITDEKFFLINEENSRIINLDDRVVKYYQEKIIKYRKL